MSEFDDENRVPRSIRQKQVLERAAERPEASITEIAEDVPSATEDLVERVLEEHGDPAASEADEDTASDAPPASSESETYPQLADITDRERETLEAIAARPEASQRELAETLDVTAATVSTRVNGLPGFEWTDRQAFVEAVLNVETLPDRNMPANSESETVTQESFDEVVDRIIDIEQELQTLGDSLEKSGQDSRFDDPELVHKVAHACLESEAITEDEELRILEELLR